MNLIAKLLPPANILLDLEASSKKRLFELAAQMFEANQQLNQRIVFDSLFAREKLGSTGLGQAVAIPHGRIKNLREATGAFIKPLEPVSFDAPDGRPVSLIFILLVPEQATDLHLQILGELAEMFSDKALRDKLLASHDANEIYQLIAGWGADDTDHRSTAI